MQRRSFLKKTGIAGLSLLLPNLTYATVPSVAMLTGQKSPKLYNSKIPLQIEVAQAFIRMQKDARKQGIQIHLLSGYRSFNRQKTIWNNKYMKYTRMGYSPEKAIELIIEKSSMPGTSRHHWGTDLDIVDVQKVLPKSPLNEDYFHDDNYFGEFRVWMEENAAKHGFVMTYTNDPKRHGVDYEPWHFSYAPLSRTYLDELLKIDVIEILNTSNVYGSKHISNRVWQNYKRLNIMDINPDLLP